MVDPGIENSESKAATCCQRDAPRLDAPWICAHLQTPVGEVPVAATRLLRSEIYRSLMARCGIRRMNYRVQPGLYAVGRPGGQSPVFVSANYKMSFDRLRSQLRGIDSWILVLDTKGINVWCAAGKGTFGTDELVIRIRHVRLRWVVSHRKLILPQLAATGVSAHEVRRRSGFGVTYGPVRARDLPAFLDVDMKATPQMRRVRFSLRDRVVLIPAELIVSAKYALAAAVLFLVLSGLGSGIYSLDRVVTHGLAGAAILLAVYVASTALPPALLPWLPGRAFSVKGLWIGLVLAAAVLGYGWYHPDAFAGQINLAGWLLMVPAVTSFLAMNFTGCSTYTSLSGVRKEMHTALPIQISTAALGLTLWITGLFL